MSLLKRGLIALTISAWLVVSLGCSGGLISDSLVYADEGHRRAALQASNLILDGRLLEAAEMIKTNGLNTRPDIILFYSSAGCSTESMRFLIDELGLDPLTEVAGETTVYSLVVSDEVSIDPERDCSEQERVGPVRVLLEEGVDPCLAPNWAPGHIPAHKASEWGRLQEMADLLRDYSANC